MEEGYTLSLKQKLMIEATPGNVQKGRISPIRPARKTSWPQVDMYTDLCVHKDFNVYEREVTAYKFDK